MKQQHLDNFNSGLQKNKKARAQKARQYTAMRLAKL